MNEVIILGLALLAKLIWDWSRDRRQSRSRADFRHVIGCKPWWGER